MSNDSQTLSQILAAETPVAHTPEDLIHSLVPLMEQVAQLHALGLVAQLHPDAILDTGSGKLGLANTNGITPKLEPYALLKIQNSISSAVKFSGDFSVVTDQLEGRSVENLMAFDGVPENLVKPIYLTGYRTWEQALGHHDESVDIFTIGMLIASLAFNLDFRDLDDLKRFVSARSDLFRLNANLHPAVARLISVLHGH
jgi:hypothetical protein